MHPSILSSIERAEESARHAPAIKGMLYDSGDCLFSECIARDGKVFSFIDAKLLNFKKDCRCTLLAYSPEWGIDINAHIEKNRKRREDRMLVANRSKAREDIICLLNKGDTQSLIRAREILAKSDLKFHPYDLQSFSDICKKNKSYDHALMWIGAAIQARLEGMTSEEDSIMASLYVSQGAIRFSMKQYPNALQNFFTALRHYNWTPTKTLSSKITSTLKKLDLTDSDFLNVVAVSKREGFLKGLSYLRSRLGFIENN
jgi:hypothetical protein